MIVDLFLIQMTPVQSTIINWTKLWILYSGRLLRWTLGKEQKFNMSLYSILAKAGGTAEIMAILLDIKGILVFSYITRFFCWQ